MVRRHNTSAIEFAFLNRQKFWLNKKIRNKEQKIKK